MKVAKAATGNPGATVSASMPSLPAFHKGKPTKFLNVCRHLFRSRGQREKSVPERDCMTARICTLAQNGIDAALSGWRECHEFDG